MTKALFATTGKTVAILEKHGHGERFSVMPFREFLESLLCGCIRVYVDANCQLVADLADGRTIVLDASPVLMDALRNVDIATLDGLCSDAGALADALRAIDAAAEAKAQAGVPELVPSIDLIDPGLTAPAGPGGVAGGLLPSGFAMPGLGGGLPPIGALGSGGGTPGGPGAGDPPGGGGGGGGGGGAPAPMPPAFAIEDRFTVRESRSLAGDLFANDVQPGGAIRTAVVTPPTIGSLTLNPDGTFVYTPPAYYSGEVTFRYSFVDPRTGSVKEADATITVLPVADAAIGSGGSSGNEDSVIATPITVALADTDGSERLASVTISGVPSGASLGWNGALPGTVDVQSDGGLRITGSTAEIQAILQSITVSPAANSDADFALTVTAVTAEAGPFPTGSVPTTTTSFAVPVTVAAVADRPGVTAPALFSTEEDTPIALGGLGGSLADTDGSETLTFRISGVPAGATLGAGRDLGGGVWELTAAQIAAGITFAPGLHAHGAYDLTLTAIATEARDGSVATSSTPFRIVVDAQADAPTAGGSSSGNEDGTLAFGRDATYSLVDADGSERVSGVVISGVPAGWTVAYNGALPGIAFDGTRYTLTGTPAEIRAALDSFTIAPPGNADRNASIAIAVTTTDADGSTATTSYAHALGIAAVADPGTGSGSARGNEDAAIAVPVTVGLADTDGSERIEQVTVTGVPAGGTLGWNASLPGLATAVPGGWRFTADTTAELQALLASLTITPPLHSDADITLRVTVGTIESAPGESGDVAVLRATASFDVPVTVDAVADRPTVTVPASAVVTSEDTPVAIPGLGGALVDTDGSEGHAFRISGVPLGATFRNPAGNAVGSTADGTTWSFTPAEIAAGLTFVPIADMHGSYTMLLTSIATETSNADVATNAAQFTVIVNAVADAPRLTTGSTTTPEDTSAVFGTGISYALGDTDGSERVSSVAIGGVPAGASIGYTLSGAGVVTRSVDGATYTITGTEAEIRAILDTFRYVPAGNSDVNVGLTVAVTVTDANGATATTSGVHGIVVQAVADVPSISAPAAVSVNEDSTVAVPVTVALRDTDGSETLNYVSITGLPSGASLGWSSAYPAVTATAIAGGFEFRGPTADIEALLTTLTLRPAHNSDADFTLRVTAGSIESNPSGGEIAVPTATSTVDIPVTVTAVADAPTVPTTTSSGNEDTAIAFGRNITYTLTDTDGSEASSAVALSGFPAGSTVSYVVAGGATVVLSGGIYAISGTPAAIRATLDSFSYRAPAHGDGDISISVAAASTDNDGSTATTTGTHTITVDAVADVPSGSGSGSGGEDTVISVPITVALTDTDGSETIDLVRITGVPAGATLGWSGAYPGVTVLVGAGSYEFHGPTADIRSLLQTVTLTPPLHSDADISLSVTVQSVESNPNGAVATPTASTTFTVPVTVTAIADAPTVPSGSSSGNEDTTIAFGRDIAYSLVDTDGSEAISSVALSGFPPGSSIGYTAAGGASVILSSGVYTISGTPAAIRATLDSFTYRAPLHGDNEAAVGVAVTTRDNDGSTATTSATHTINVHAVADAPSGSGSGSGNEDSVIAVPITVTLADTDGSETIDTVQITGVPAGATLAWSSAFPAVTATAIAGGYAFSGPTADIRSLLATVTVAPPLHSDADFSLSVLVRTIESNPNGAVATSTATTTFTVPVTVIAVADTPTATANTGFTTVEDVPVAITGLGGALVDTDGSETISYRISNVPTSATLSHGTSIGGGVWTLTAAQMAAANAAGGLTFTPPPQAHGTYTMTLTSTATEASNGDFRTATADFTVTVTPVLDVPSVANTFSVVREDTQFALGQDINVSLADRDGSQSLSIAISGIPTGTALVWTGRSGVTVDNTGGVLTIYGNSPNDVLTVLDSVRATPAANSDANFTLTVEATTTEAGGTSTIVTGSHLVEVRAVADRPTVSASGTGNEDTAIAVPVTVTLADTDGSETFDYVDVTGVPSGATLGWNALLGPAPTAIAGGYRFAGTTAEVQALLGSLTLTPGLHNGNDIRLTISARAIESSPTESGVNATTGVNEVATSTNTRTITVNVNVIPVADQPTVTVPANQTITEDTPVALTGLGGALVDADGSETLTFQLSGAPSGASFVNGSGNPVGTLSGGVWSFTAAQITAGISFVPPVNANGTYTMTLTSIATEGENGSRATNQDTFSLTYVQEADRPTISGSSIVNEDTAVTFGQNITVALADTDGSERIQSISISGFPAGVTPTYSATLGTASVTESGGVYTITSSSPDWTVAQADIQALLDTFALTPPAESDVNFSLTVSATAEETGGSTATRTVSHAVTVRAVADAPTVTATSPASGNEDSADIPLVIDANRSVDMDNSETLSVRITLPQSASQPIGTLTGTTPAGVTLTHEGNGVYLVTATSEALLDSFLTSGDLKLDPRANWSGTLTGTNGIRVDAITTETGPEIATPTATTTTWIDVDVAPQADHPTVNIVNAYGDEDSQIRLSITVNLTDTDGSETYVVRLTDVPAGSTFTNGSGVAIGADLGGGVWQFTPSQVQSLHIVPPLNSNADFTMGVVAVVTDGGSVVDTIADRDTIDVTVIGVADPLTVSPVLVDTVEDVAGGIPLGAAIRTELGSDATILGDDDASETVSFVITLPPGVIPSHGTFIGSGWQVSSADLASLTIPAPPNFSGNYADFFSGFAVRVVTQENDGNQRSVALPVTIMLDPVTDGAPIGVAGWAPSVRISEGDDIPFANIVSGLRLTDGTTILSNGPENVLSITVDLSGLMASGSISANVADTADLIANYIDGITPGMINGDGTITGTPAQIAALSLQAGALVDSNVDIALPVSAVIQDGAAATVTATGTFTVDLVGAADVPTAYATDLSGNAGTPISLPIGHMAGHFGGEITDTDTTAQGRTANSETLYYIVSGLDGGSGRVGFIDGSGNLAGINLGAGMWYLTPDDLTGLRLASSDDAAGVRNLHWRAVSVENDGDDADAEVDFTLTLAPPVGGGGPGDAPQDPDVAINSATALEDGTIVLDVTAFPAAGDPTNPSLSVVLTSLPAGVTMSGAIFNPVRAEWILPVDATTGRIVSSVVIRGPTDFAGHLDFPLRVVATSPTTLRETARTEIASVDVTPVADGPSISASPAPLQEDATIALNLSITPRDSDTASPETVVLPIRVTVPAGATLTAGTLIAANTYEVAAADLPGLALIPPAHRHGTLSITVEAQTRDIDGSLSPIASQSISLTLSAVPDAPIVPAAGTVSGSGTEDSPIAITGLAAGSVRLVDTDGSEVLSVIIGNVPVGTRILGATNNGDGTWTVPASVLPTLQIVPPLNYSGTMTLTLTAFAIEASTGASASSSTSFQVSVAPVADSYVIDAANLTSTGVAASLTLDIRGQDDTGALAGENAAEQVELTFSNLPSGTLLTGPVGTFVDLGGGRTWRYTGPVSGAESIQIQPGASGTYTVSISGVSIDGTDRLATPVVDTFILDATVATAAVTATGTPGADTLTGSTAADTLDGAGGNDTLYGGAGDDLLIGGQGADAMNGGLGNDTYDVDDPGDTVIEASGAGTDLVRASVSHALAANVENLTLTGAGDIDGTGNGLANNIIGNDGNNTLDGGGGDDTLDGGDGNDTYIVDSAGDLVIEGPGGGTDLVIASASHTLSAEVENLTLTGSASINGTGNGLANIIVGNGGSNLIEGGGGADVLTGGAGSDTFVYRIGDTGVAPDRITDFSSASPLAGGDVLNLHDLLPGFNPGIDPISDWVRLTESGGDTTVEIDPTGAGSFTVEVAVLEGVTGADLGTLRSQGNIVV